MVVWLIGCISLEKGKRIFGHRLSKLVKRALN